jgi:hypothetical protein
MLTQPEARMNTPVVLKIAGKIVVVATMPLNGPGGCPDYIAR